MQDIQVGDPEFDRQFILQSNRGEAVQRLLSDSNLQRQIMTHAKGNLALDQSLTFTHAGILTDPERLTRLFELFIDLLRRIDNQQ